MSDDQMAFPDTWEEFEKEYGFTDTEEIYTNGARLIPSFRVEQWLEHLQAVPVIHCKDCKYVGTDATCCLVCNRPGMGLRPFHVYHDDFCSYADRRKHDGVD